MAGSSSSNLIQEKLSSLVGYISALLILTSFELSPQKCVSVCIWLLAYWNIIKFVLICQMWCVLLLVGGPSNLTDGTYWCGPMQNVVLVLKVVEFHPWREFFLGTIWGIAWWTHCACFNHLNRWFLRLPFVDDLTVSLEQIGFVYMLMLSRCPGDSQLGWLFAEMIF